MNTYKNIEALHKDLRACRLCASEGYTIESLPVFSGKQAARLMLIGQAPGISEAPHGGDPFSGSAGKRLFQWLDRAGWDEATFREKCYITSVTKCFPGKNPNGDGDRVPSAAERKLCNLWLEWELKLVQPEVLVPVGRLAITRVFPIKVRLDEVIGQVFHAEEGRQIVPLPHPSGASRWHMNPRNVGLIDEAIFRLKMLKAELEL